MGRKHTDATKTRFREVGSERAKKAWETKRKNGTGTPWNKGKTVPQISNEKNPSWKGSAVSYFGLHAWVSRKLGRPKHCAYCGTTKKKMYHWANISKAYRRDLSDWIRLCVPCHSLFDKGKIKV